MGNCHPTRLFCHSSTAAGYICYILRAILAGFIGGSSPIATVEDEPGGRIGKDSLCCGKRPAAGFVLGHPRGSEKLKLSACGAGQMELLAADGTWVCGIGRLWGAAPIFWRVQRQPLLSPAPQQQVQTGD
jgi:hypothetical protein